MTPQELALAVDETLMKEKQKKVPFQSYCKRISLISFIKYLIKYGEITYEEIGILEYELRGKKDELKQRELEIAEALATAAYEMGIEPTIIIMPGAKNSK